MDMRTVFKLTLQALMTNDQTRLNILADALADCGMAPEEQQIRECIALMSAQVDGDFIRRQFAELLQARSGRLWAVRRSGCRDGHTAMITVSSSMNRRVARNGCRSVRHMNDEDYAFLRQVFTGKRMAFKGDTYCFRIPERPGYLLYALDLVKGVERSDPRAGCDSLMATRLGFLWLDEPEVPEKVPESHYR